MCVSGTKIAFASANNIEGVCELALPDYYLTGWGGFDLNTVFSLTSKVAHRMKFSYQAKIRTHDPCPTSDKRFSILGEVRHM